MNTGPQAIAYASPESAREFVASIDLGQNPQTEAPFARQWLRPTLHNPLSLLLGIDRAAVADLEGPQQPTIAQAATGADAIGLKVQTGSDQAFLVGNQLLSFASDVTEQRRAASVNSCLLAQLRASKLHPSPDTPEAAEAWHASYVNTLINLGWVLQSGTTAFQSTDTSDSSVDKVLLEVIGALLGGGAAITLATKVIQAIATAAKDDPMLVLYQSRVVEQSVVEFATGLASGTGAGFALSVVECAMLVRSRTEQILFFKWSADSASAKGRRFDFGLSDAVYASVQQQIEQKLAPVVQDFVANLAI